MDFVFASLLSHDMLRTCVVFFLKGSKCHFIGWYDGPMCERSKAIIPGLLRTINKVKAQTTRLKIYLLCSWIFFVYVLFYK